MHFETKDFAVGYAGVPLIQHIDMAIERGGILCLIGPNGSGKSTILKSITRHIASLAGSVYVGGEEISRMRGPEMARRLSAMLTERVSPELMTCEEVVAIGRYPYTNRFGKLTQQDHAIIDASLGKVNALDLKERFFETLSDGQRQRVLLAKALCQQPEVIVLDEPTSYLDIRHKIELLGILREMCLKTQLTVVLSLHEVDLAAKLSDVVVMIRDDAVYQCGAPEDVLTDESVRALYGIHSGSFDMLMGSIELPSAPGEARVFVVAGDGTGTRCFRALQKKGIAFTAGVLQGNDIDCRVARRLAAELYAAPSFGPPDASLLATAMRRLLSSDLVIDCAAPIGCYNAYNADLLKAACARGIPIYSLREESLEGVVHTAFDRVYDLIQAAAQCVGLDA